MNKYENFIYLSICEISLPMAKVTSYSNYVYYCRGMGNSLRGSGGLSIREQRDFLKIADYLNLIYGLSVEDRWKYIKAYFNSDRFMEFQQIVSLTNELFPFTGHDDKWINK